MPSRPEVGRELEAEDPGEVISRHPLRHGLAELVAYLQLAADWPHAAADEENQDLVEWQTDDGTVRRARMPRVIFVRNG